MTRRQRNILIQRLTQEAEAGNPIAQWELGSWLEDGFVDPHGTIVVRPDPRAAVSWYRRSATLGCSAAQNALGVCLSSGKGIERNEQEALAWLKRALRQGDDCAANNIACVYRDRGEKREAFRWYQRAADTGDGDALVEVGVRYYKGVGVRRDPTRAVHCFRKAIRGRKVNISQAGRESAMYHLAIAYSEGLGVRRSASLAAKWLERADVDGDFTAARALLISITGQT